MVDSESLLIVSMWTTMASWFTPTILFCVTNLIIGTLLIASNNNNGKSHDDQVQGDSSTRITRVSSFLNRARSINLSSYTTTSVADNLSSYVITSASHHEKVSHPPSPSKTPNYSSSSRLAQSIYVAQPSQLTRAPSLLERVKSIKLSSIYNDDTSHTESEQMSNSTSQLTRAPSFLDRVKSFKMSYPFQQVPPSIQPENVDTYPSDHITGDHPPVIRTKSEKPPRRRKLLVEIKKSRSEMKMADDDVDLRRPATTRESRNHVVDEEVDAKADDFISKFKQQLKLQRLESLVRYNQTLKSRQC
uniref:pathogen-associated molecular patterns-induced protein A70-like n=1 Tax=Erigeron canadensis TaxID=72917 RepID=UPI001CB90DCB|nr:pathogen-associated molecular patterns-induced protein A70-like [Erigeron canadensis]